MKISGVLGLSQARKRAKSLLGDVAKDKDPLDERRKASAAAGGTLKAICEDYLKRDGKRLRTGEAQRKALDRLVYPRLGARLIGDIRRSDIVKLLDQIEDGSGPVMADRTLASIRKIMNWYATRDDDFRSPIVRGMARTKGKERARSRILTDDELRALWPAADAMAGPFGRLVQFLLLTAARRGEAAEMVRDEIEAAGADWALPAERNKVKVDFVRPLSPAARDVLGKLPKIGKRGLVFTTDGRNAIGAFSKFKAKLDEASGVTGWTLHDLRRTARSLMSRAGIEPDHAERCLGHVIGGVRGTYDRHEYHAEKKRAFEALAAQLDRIVNPVDNVVALRATNDRLPHADRGEGTRTE
jgi:integrase